MDEQKMTFEQAMARLEEIVRAMEKGDTLLDESLGLFEEGTTLVRFLTKTLDEAEQRVTILIKDESGRLVEKKFGGTDEQPDET